MIVTLPDDTATLLKHDGTEFAGGPAAVQKLAVSYDKAYPEIIVFANNTRGFSAIGDDQPRIDSFTIEAYARATVTGIMNSIARESTLGVFTLRVPDVTNPGSTTVDLYLVRFFECSFAPQTPRRRGNPQVYTADVTDIETLDHAEE